MISRTTSTSVFPPPSLRHFSGQSFILDLREEAVGDGLLGGNPSALGVWRWGYEGLNQRPVSLHVPPSTPHPSRSGSITLFFCSLLPVSFEGGIFKNSVFWIDLREVMLCIYWVVCITEWCLGQNPIIKPIYILQ